MFPLLRREWLWHKGIAEEGYILSKVGLEWCACLRHIKIDQNRPWHDWASPGVQAPSFPHPEPPHLQYLKMSGASVLAGAHHFVARDNMFITANAVSRTVVRL